MDWHSYDSNTASGSLSSANSEVRVYVERLEHKLHKRSPVGYASGLLLDDLARGRVKVSVAPEVFRKRRVVFYVGSGGCLRPLRRASRRPRRRGRRRRSAFSSAPPRARPPVLGIHAVRERLE